MARPTNTKNWQALLEEYRRGSETQAEFCRARGLALSTLTLKLRERSKTFVKVGGSERVEVELRDGTLLRVDPSNLRIVLEALSDNAVA